MNVKTLKQRPPDPFTSVNNFIIIMKCRINFPGHPVLLGSLFSYYSPHQLSVGLYSCKPNILILSD